MQDMNDVLTKLLQIKSKLRVTKLVCSRTVKGRGGDTFVGFSVATDSVQEDGLKGLSDTDSDVMSSGMSLSEARLASHVLSLEVNIAAHEHAVAGGLINRAEFAIAERAIKVNYGLFLKEALAAKEETTDE